METRIFLMNTVTDPITVSISALGGGGAELPLGERVIEPLRHVELSLAESLRGFKEGFGAGSLRVRLLGDPDTIRGWAVIEGGDGETFEIPLAAPQKTSGVSSYAFWSADSLSSALRGSRPSVHLANTSDEPLAVLVTSGTGGRTRSERIKLEPSGRMTLPLRSRGARRSGKMKSVPTSAPASGTVTRIT